MWSFENIQSFEFMVVFGLAVLGVIFWITYSLQEILIIYRMNIKKKSEQHAREVEKYREELKKWN